MPAKLRICVIGNCQIAPLRLLLKALHGNVETYNLPAVHTMSERQERAVCDAVTAADWVFGQAVSDEFHVEFVRTSVLRSKCHAKLIVWPNVYFSGYAPEFSTLRDQEYHNFTGPLLDYHSDKIIVAFFRGLSLSRTVDLISHESALDAAWYGNAVDLSLDALRRREKDCDVSISDFLSENYVTSRLFYIMNHPAIMVLQELACRLLRLAGAPALDQVPNLMFSDLELVSAMHPENPFIRRQQQLQFPAIRHYRGVDLVNDSSKLGVTPNGARIYVADELVQETFRLYERHRSRLLNHGRVKELLSRAWTL
jgi:hypothetical protein